MIFSLLRYGTSRCQIRHPKLPSFSTSPCRRSNGNPNDAFAERPFLQSILNNEAQDKSLERPQQEESHTRNTDRDGRYNRPTVTERDANRAPAYADSICNPRPERERGLESYLSSSEKKSHAVYDGASQGIQASSRETDMDLASLDSLGKEQGELFDAAKVRLLEAVRVDDPQLLLLEFWEATREPAMMRAIPTSTFLEILRLLDPGDEFAPFRREYSESQPKHYYMLQGQTRELYKTMKDRRTLYRDIWKRRLLANQGMDVREYASLLRLARATWDGGGALAIMKDMLERNVQPDLICYNYYFEARCWSDVWQPTERQRLRVVPFTKIIRRKSPTEQRRGMTIKGHKIEKGGLKWETTRLFTKMIGDGIMADTTAFGHLITALAREGDLEGVKSILLKAWDVDVDAMSEADNEAQQETPVPMDSPLYPNSGLLFVIAHAFGSNNDLPAAIRIVDHFSRKFKLTIPKIVWAQLLEWTFVLSTRRHKLRKEDGTQLGQLPLQSVESLFNVMTSEPYCIKPKLDMYDFLIRSFWRQSELDSMLKYIPKGVEIHRKHVGKYKKHATLLAELESQTPKDRDVKDLQLEKRLAEVAKARRYQSFAAIHKWFMLLLSRRHWFPLTRDTQVVFWERQGLPNAVGAFWGYRYRYGVKYTMATGIVQLRDGEPLEATVDLNREVGT